MGEGVGVAVIEVVAELCRWLAFDGVWGGTIGLVVAQTPQRELQCKARAHVTHMCLIRLSIG